MNTTAKINKKKKQNIKVNDKLMVALHQLLADELTAINPYKVTSEMCNQWGYGKLIRSRPRVL
jgi:bacterioferritin (cytochrome b1)